jgi:hypothetical protein
MDTALTLRHAKMRKNGSGVLSSQELASGFRLPQEEKEQHATNKEPRKPGKDKLE